MTYQQALLYLNSFINYEKIADYSYQDSLRLDRVRDFLRLLGSPEKGLKIIHVAGSKGKGSVCAFCAYILREAGFSVGLYTSPHLSDLRERIRVLRPHPAEKKDAFEGLIPRPALARLTKTLQRAVKVYQRSKAAGRLSFFEVFTALAFLYFKEKRVDFVVLETGLGGRLDATNAASSLVCVITPISLEHTQKLGKTVAAIATEKAGIIKEKRSIVLAASQDKKARQVFRDKCLKAGARLYEAGRDIKYNGCRRAFSVSTPWGRCDHLRIRLLGRHQLANAALAVGAVKALSCFGFQAGPTALRKGLQAASWPARCEVFRRNPLVVLDGAQNLASAKALKEAVRDNFKFRKLILVIGVSSDKDIRGICKQLKPLAREVILTASHNPRAMDPVELSGYFRGAGKSPVLHITGSVKEAKALALRAAAKDDLILVTGSLFVAGEFRDA
ncbi:MAG: folylpolyglutamate synthase/dihydrofolate synthase family protein [Candidatus Omnitrophota bacterium]